MKKSYFPASAVLLYGAILSSCHENTVPKNCSLVPVSYVANGNGTVIYSASKSGDAKISTITYITPSGPVTVVDPMLPFQTDLNVSAGDTVRILATGVATDGSVSAGFSYSNGTDLVEDSDECSN